MSRRNVMSDSQSKGGLAADAEKGCESGCDNINELTFKKKTLKTVRKFRKAYLTYTSYKEIKEPNGTNEAEKQDGLINKDIEDLSIKDLDKMTDKALDPIRKSNNDCRSSANGYTLSLWARATRRFEKVSKPLKNQINKAIESIDGLNHLVKQCCIAEGSIDRRTSDSNDDSKIENNNDTTNDSCLSSESNQDPCEAESVGDIDHNELKEAQRALEEAKTALVPVKLGEVKEKLEEAKGKVGETKESTNAKNEICEAEKALTKLKSEKMIKKAKENYDVKILKLFVKQSKKEIDNYAEDRIGIELTNRLQKAVLYCAAVALVFLFGAPLVKQIVINLLSTYDVHLLEILRQAKLLKDFVNSFIVLRKVLLPMFTAVLAAFTTVSDWRVKRIDALLDDCDDAQKKLLKQSHYYVDRKSWPGVFMALTVITTLCTAMSAFLSI